MFSFCSGKTGRLLFNPFFWIFDPIQIHHKYVIGNLNPLFKLTNQHKSNNNPKEEKIQLPQMFVGETCYSQERQQSNPAVP